MILALDVGNSQLFGGVFEDGQLRFQFRRKLAPQLGVRRARCSSCEAYCVEQRYPGLVDRIAICSVVPEMLYSLRSCCRKYFAVDPFVLQAGARTGLKSCIAIQRKSVRIASRRRSPPSVVSGQEPDGDRLRHRHDN